MCGRSHSIKLIKKMVMLMFWASIIWNDLAHATPPGFESVPLKEVSVSVILGDARKESRRIYIRMSKDRKLRIVCIDRVCNDILSSFPIVKDISDVYVDNLTVLRGIQYNNKGWIRIILKFSVINNEKCASSRTNIEDKAIALTFDKYGKIKSVAVICGFNGLYYENMR